MQANRSRSFDASCVDRLFVGAVVGSQMEPGRCSQGHAARAMRPGRCAQGDAARCPSACLGQLFASRSASLSPSESKTRLRNRHENRSKIGPGASPGLPKSTQNRSQDPLGTPSGAQGRPGAVSERLGSVPGEPRELQESPQGRPGTPKEAPRNAPERSEATKIDAESRPQAKKSSFFRSARSRSVVGPIFRQFSAISGFSAKSANPLKYCAC